MAGGILKIKNSIPPLGQNVLSRPHLIEKLESFLNTGEGFTRNLTLFSAPAGYGKTTAVRSWLNGRENETAWLTLDEEDNDPLRFWIYLLSALQNLHSSIGLGPMEMLESSNIITDQTSSFNHIYAPLLNDLFMIEKPSFLVIDDYHLINEQSIHRDLAFFIENLPPTLHVIITTRSDPPWPLSSWRAKQVMIEMRMADLVFSEEETVKFFEIQKAPKLKESQFKTLYDKTEGWITGLKLAAYSLASSLDVENFINFFAGSHRHVLLFLSEEVYNNQNDETKDFLIQTSILNRLSVALCDAVTGRNDSEEMIEALEKENLFIIPLDEQGTWFRYHPLFTDLLQHNLKRKNPDLIKQLHEKAGQWYLEAGEAVEAVRHCITAGNNLEAGKILHDHYNELLLSDGPGLLYRSLHSIDPDNLDDFPRLLAHNALFELITAGRENADKYIKRAEKLSYTDEQENNEYQGILHAIKAYFSIFNYDFSGAVEYAQKALELLPANNFYWKMNVAIYLGDAALFSGNPAKAYPYYREAYNSINLKAGNRLLILTATFKMASSLYFLGSINETEQLIRDAIQDARENGLSNIPRMGLHWTLLGEILREKGMLDDAERCIERGLLYSEPEKPCYGWNLIFKIALHYSRKEYELALETIREAEQLNYDVKLPSFVNAAVERWKCKVLAVQGEFREALTLLSVSGIEKGKPVIEGSLWRYLVLAQILITSDEKDLYEAGRILNQLEVFALQGEYMNLYLETMLTKAMLEETKGSSEEAEKLLLQTIIKGYESGYLQIFKDSFNKLSSLFSKVLTNLDQSVAENNEDLAKYLKRISSDYATRPLIDPAIKKGEAAHTGSEEPVGSELIEPLTARELEILDLIKEGLSNESIAKTLFLSLGTVKWHTTNIYGKLGVRRRTEAVAQARKLKLIN